MCLGAHPHKPAQAWILAPEPGIRPPAVTQLRQPPPLGGSVAAHEAPGPSQAEQRGAGDPRVRGLLGSGQAPRGNPLPRPCLHLLECRPLCPSLPRRTARHGVKPEKRGTESCWVLFCPHRDAPRALAEKQVYLGQRLLA